MAILDLRCSFLAYTKDSVGGRLREDMNVSFVFLSGKLVIIFVRFSLKSLV